MIQISQNVKPVIRNEKRVTVDNADAINKVMINNNISPDIYIAISNKQILTLTNTVSECKLKNDDILYCINNNNQVARVNITGTRLSNGTISVNGYNATLWETIDSIFTYNGGSNALSWTDDKMNPYLASATILEVLLNNMDTIDNINLIYTGSGSTPSTKKQVNPAIYIAAATIATIVFIKRKRLF